MLVIGVVKKTTGTYLHVPEVNHTGRHAAHIRLIQRTPLVLYFRLWRNTGFGGDRLVIGQLVLKEFVVIAADRLVAPLCDQPFFLRTGPFELAQDKSVEIGRASCK